MSEIAEQFSEITGVPLPEAIEFIEPFDSLQDALNMYWEQQQPISSTSTSTSTSTVRELINEQDAEYEAALAEDRRREQERQRDEKLRFFYSYLESLPEVFPLPTSHIGVIQVVIRTLNNSRFRYATNKTQIRVDEFERLLDVDQFHDVVTIHWFVYGRGTLREHDFIMPNETIYLDFQKK